MDELSDFFNEFFGEDSFFSKKDFDKFNNNFRDDMEGTNRTDMGEDEHGKFQRTTFISNDGKFSYVKKTYISSENKKSGGKEIETIEELESKLKLAVKKEEYEKAAELRDKIKKLNSKKKK